MKLAHDNQTLHFDTEQLKPDEIISIKFEGNENNRTVEAHVLYEDLEPLLKSKNVASVLELSDFFVSETSIAAECLVIYKERKTIAMISNVFTWEMKLNDVEWNQLLLFSEELSKKVTVAC